MIKCSKENPEKARLIAEELAFDFKENPSRLDLFLHRLMTPSTDENILAKIFSLGANSIEFLPELCKSLQSSDFIDSFLLP